MSLSNLLSQDLVDHVTGNAAYTAESPLFIALTTAEPNGDGSNIAAVEIETPATNGYARFEITTPATFFTAATLADPSVTQNDTGQTASFGPATADWNGGAAFNGFAVMNSATLTTAAAYLWGGTLTSSATVLNTQSAEFAAAAFRLTLT